MALWLTFAGFALLLFVLLLFFFKDLVMSGNEKKIELEVAEILNRMPSDLALVILLREKGGTRCLPVL